MPTPLTSTPGVFDASHYAGSAGKKLVRCLQLGPKYYLWDLPHYLAHRRAVGLSAWDPAALWNPTREIRPGVSVTDPLPPGCDEAIETVYRAGVRLTIPRHRLEGLLRIWWSCREIPGDFIECGSYRGATGVLLAVLGKMHGLKQMFHLLDTFAGMPTPSRFDRARGAGEFAPPDRDAVEQLHEWAKNAGVADCIEVHRGLFGDTFPGLRDRGLRFAVAHVDANIYPSTKEACEFVLPRVNPGGAIVFDDYNGVCDLGARLAIHEVLRGLRPAPLAAYSAYLRVSASEP